MRPRAGKGLSLAAAARCGLGGFVAAGGGDGAASAVAVVMADPIAEVAARAGFVAAFGRQFQVVVGGSNCSSPRA